MTNLGRSAVWYSQRLGWAVFPLVPREKIPLVPKSRGGNGCLDATTDADRVMAWWRDCPEANVGIAMGAASGIFAVDYDPRNAPDGASLEELCQSFGTFPETVEAVTGGGGRHLLYRYTDDLAVVKWTPLAPGIDTKGQNGYVVACPSIHPNGKPYTWEASHRPDDVAIADPPSWLVELLMRNRRDRTGGGYVPTGEALTEAERFILGREFASAGWLGEQARAGVWNVRCPTEHLHSCGERFDSSTVLFAPTNDRGPGWFWCSHGHCQGHYGGFDDVVRAIRRVVASEERTA